MANSFNSFNLHTRHIMLFTFRHSNIFRLSRFPNRSLCCTMQSFCTSNIWSEQNVTFMSKENHCLWWLVCRTLPTTSVYEVEPDPWSRRSEDRSVLRNHTPTRSYPLVTSTCSHARRRRPVSPLKSIKNTFTKPARNSIMIDQYLFRFVVMPYKDFWHIGKKYACSASGT